jgi:DNA polymerase
VNILYLDTETFSTVPIKHGEYKYAEGARVLLVSWAVNEGPACVAEWGPDTQHQLRFLVQNADRIVIHKAEFDRTVLFIAHGVVLPLEKIYCTCAQARSHGLPGALDTLCELLRLPADKAKDKEGKKYINLFCKPQKNGKVYDKTTHPTEWAGFKAYARQDIVPMREVYRRLPHWNDEVDRGPWLLDQRINQRGFQVDEDLARKMIALVDEEKAQQKKKTVALTNGEVESTTQRDKLLGYILAAHGVGLPDLAADTVERRLKDETLPEAVKELLRLRLEASRSSTAKYKRALECVSSDGRLRGTKVHRGAHRTGRASGQRFQPDNMPRPRLKKEENDRAIRAVKARCLHLIATHPVSTYAADAVRGTMVASEGKSLYVADLSAIEARVVAWLAGEEPALEAFERQDAGGPDVYNLTYADAFGIDVDEVTPAQRQVGKAMKLLLGFGGGVAAFLTGAATYRIDLEDLVKGSWHTFSPALQAEAIGYYRWAVKKGKDLGLPWDVFCTCWCLMKLWRRGNPAIVAFWKDLEDAVVAVLRGADPQYVGRLMVDRPSGWVRVQLPSGRFLSYPSMREENGNLSYYGVDPYTHRLGRIRTWGGTLVENATQAAAADQLFDGLLNMEACGEFFPVMHTHDEAICEGDEGLDVDDLCAQLCVRTPWNGGLPLAAKGFVTDRYYKG